MVKSVRHVAALAALGSFLMAGTALAEGAKIGALIPLTGGLQSYGEASLDGMMLAIDEVNAAGGVLGGPIEVIVGDTQTKAQAAIDAAKKMVSVDGVVGILGALASGNTIPVATSVSAVDQIPQISNASTAPAITTLADNDFLFRTVPSDAYQGAVLAGLTDAAGIGSVAVLYINNDYGVGLAESFAAGYGGNITSSAAFEPNKASYRGELQAAAEGDPEALLLIAYPDDGGLLILRQSLEEGFFDRFVVTDGLKTAQLVDDIGAEYMEGVFGTAAGAVDNDASAHFAAAYEAKHGELPPLPYIDSGFDAAMILALAIEKAGSTDGPAIRDALREVTNAPGEPVGPGDFAKAKELIAAGTDIDYQGAAGNHEFDENGDVTGIFEHWAVKDGTIVSVEMIE
jgi:ABC-type branched-subunit amino acid transport system substrate-binding protein